MSAEQHINSLLKRQNRTLGASEALGAAGYYAHSLFFGHLVLEKFMQSVMDEA